MARQKKAKISINEVDIPQVTSCKVLGVYIEQKLTWNMHVEHLHNRITTNLHLLRSLRNVLPMDSLRKVYFTHIHSHLIFGMNVWGSMISSAQATGLFKQQKQCMCIISNHNQWESIKMAFKKFNVLKFTDMVQLEMYKLG